MRLKNWSCPRCKTSDPAFRYPSGKISRCMDCQKFYNLGVNATRSRRTRAAPPDLLMTHEQFLAWVRSAERKCAYCGLKEEDVPKVGMKTQIGLDLQTLGIDRIDSTKGYSGDNIVLCCFACNKAKGNVFSSGEMEIIGKGIAEVWTRRLVSTTG